MSAVQAAKFSSYTTARHRSAIQRWNFLVRLSEPQMAPSSEGLEKDGRLAQSVRAPALQAGGRRFESCTAHHTFLVRPNKKRASFVLLAFLKLWVVLMKRSALLLCASLLVSIGALAQSSDEGMHAPDGGTIERFNSILIPPVLHAPFSSTVTAEWTKILEDGGTLTVQNHRLVVR